MTGRERDPVDAQYESIHMALTTKVSAPMVATAVKNLDALAARLEAAERRLRDAEALLDHYDRTSSLDPGNNRRMGALRRQFRRAEDAPDAHV